MRKIAINLRDPECFISFGALGIHRFYAGTWDGYDFGGCYGRRVTIEGASMNTNRLTNDMDKECAAAARLGESTLRKFIDDHFSVKGSPAVPLTVAAARGYSLDVRGPDPDPNQSAW